MEIVNQVAQILFDCWKYDIEMYKHAWMYWPLCIPAMFYTIFVFMKWSVLTCPFWLPFSFIVGAFKVTAQRK